MLVQVETGLHAMADKRRRLEGTNWSRVVTELLRRWAAGANVEAVAAPVRPIPTRATGPRAAEHRAWHEQQMQENETYRRAATEKVHPATLSYTSLGALIRAKALQAGRALPADALEGLDKEDGDGDV